jgi:hypothetical protein
MGAEAFLPNLYLKLKKADERTSFTSQEISYMKGLIYGDVVKFGRLKEVI